MTSSGTVIAELSVRSVVGDDQHRPAVSVAMATFNGARHLGEQLESISAQTILPMELVVSDDASTDRTLEVVRRFAATAPFAVRVLANTSRVGYVANFERALRRCTGDVFFLSDQDDVWFEAKIQRVLETFATWPMKQLLIHDRLVSDENLVGKGISTLKAIERRDGTSDSYVAGCSTALQRPLLELALPFPDLPGVGHDVWIHMLARALDVGGIVPEPLIYYRRHAENVSQSSVEPGRRASSIVSILERRKATISSALSGRRAASLLRGRDLARILASRLDDPRARVLNPSAFALARLAEQRAQALELRHAALAAPWYQRFGLLERARRLGAFRDHNGVAAYVLDALSPRLK